MKQWGENMRPLKQKVSITLDGDLIDRIRSLAEEQDRSFSQYINRAVSYTHLDVYKRQKYTSSGAKSKIDIVVDE